MHFLNPQKNTFLYNFFGASTLGQSIFCSLLFCTDLSAKNGVRMIAYHNKKFIIEIWGRFWKPQIPIAYRTKSTVMPWPKAPLPYSCAHEQGRGHRRFCAISPVPDAFVKFSQWRRRRGRCCGASVGTTGSAPSARSRPRSVVRGLCWNHWFRPSCACVLAALPCRTGGAHRTLWFLLSKKTWLLSTKKVVQV